MIIILVLFVLFVLNACVLLYLKKNKAFLIFLFIFIAIEGSFIGSKFFLHSRIDKSKIDRNDIHEYYQEYKIGFTPENIIIKSRQELLSYVENNNYQEFDWTQFNDNFFENKDLVLLVHESTDLYGIIYKSDTTLKVVIHTASVSLRLKIDAVEVEKDSIKNVEVFSEETWWWKYIYDY